MFLTYVHHGVFCFYSKKEQTCNKMNKLYTHNKWTNYIQHRNIYNNVQSIYNTKYEQHKTDSTSQDKHKTNTVQNKTSQHTTVKTHHRKQSDTKNKAHTHTHTHTHIHL